VEELELHWLAGLLEGEGYFAKPAPSRPNQPRIIIEMVDEDVIAKVSSLLERKYWSRSGRSGNQATYLTQISGRPAVRLMTELFPLMGQRRQKRIAEIIELHQAKNVIPIQRKRHKTA